MRMQYLTILLFLLFSQRICAADRTTSLVSKDHRLYEIEHEIRIRIFDPKDNYQSINIMTSDSLVVTYQKLIKVIKWGEYALEKDDLKLFDAISRHMLSQLKLASKYYPNIPVITTLYVYYDCYHGSGDSLRELIPIAHEYPEVPVISRTFYSLFNHMLRNFGPHTLKLFQERLALKQEGTVEEQTQYAREALEALTAYWAARIDPQYAKDLSLDLLKGYKESLTPEKEAVALSAWKDFASFRTTQAYIKMKQDIYNQQAEKVRSDSLKHQEGFRAIRKQDMEKDIENLSILEKPNNSLDQLFRTISKLQLYVDLINLDQIPNYKNIEDASTLLEANLANAVFLITVPFNFKDASFLLDRLMQDNPKDIRPIILRAQLLFREKNLEAILPLLEKAKEIDPNDLNLRQLILQYDRRKRIENDKQPKG